MSAHHKKSKLPSALLGAHSLQRWVRPLRAMHQGSRVMKPNFSTYYRLGVEYQNQLPPFCTLEEVGAKLGLTKQNAYTASVVALGKLIYGIREHLKRGPNADFRDPAA